MKILNNVNYPEDVKKLNIKEKNILAEEIREKLENYTNVSQFKGLPLWLACYVVYGRHSESKEITKWNKPEDIDNFLIKT